MKQLLSTALAIVLFIGAAQAQTQDGGSRHHGKGGMYKSLNLTAEQKTRFESIKEAEKTEMKALGKDADKAARKQLHEKYKAQYESILTEEQKAKLKEAKKDFKGGKMSGADRKEGRQFMGDLNLSADQKSKLTSLNQDFRTKMNTVKNNSALTTDEKRAQIKSLAEAHRTELTSMLTPEQMAKMKEARKNHYKKDRSAIL